MRKLQSTDFFTFTKIIKKMGIRTEIKKLSRELEGTKNREVAEKEMQIELIMIFVENISNAENEVYKFISDVSEKTIEELKDLDVFMAAIEAIFADGTIQSFFKSALK